MMEKEVRKEEKAWKEKEVLVEVVAENVVLAVVVAEDVVAEDMVLVAVLGGVVVVAERRWRRQKVALKVLKVSGFGER